MSLDGAFLSLVKAELDCLVGARVEKAYQPSREEVVLVMRVPYGEAKKLVFSANSSRARVNLTEAEFENPAAPPMFCMLLRKNLCGGRLREIRQDGLERVLFFDFDCVNEIGDKETNTLVCEIMGKHSNIILTRDGRVIDSVKRVTDEVSSVRRVLPNVPYEMPPRRERLCLTDCSAAEVWEQLSGRPERLAKRLTDVLEGVSPIFTRECAFRAAGYTDISCNELSEEARARLLSFLEEAKSALGGSAVYTVVKDDDGRGRDFCFVDIKQYSGAMKITRAGGANALLDEFFSSVDKFERARARSLDLTRLVTGAYERTARKLELQRGELADCAARGELRRFGDLINANIYRLEKGMKSCTLEDFETGEPVEIALDARLTPAANAQKYYAEYRKRDNAEKMLTGLIKKGEEELLYLDSVLDELSRAEGEEELADIREELTAGGYLRRKNAEAKQKKRRAKADMPLCYRSSDGYEILVGRNNRQNDLLTLKTARGSDIWLHTKDIPGSHVIIVTNGTEPPETTLVEAARIAAYHSKAREGSGVAVDYTAVKYVKKPNGAKPGMVIFTNNHTLYVTPMALQIKD